MDLKKNTAFFRVAAIFLSIAVPFLLAAKSVLFGAVYFWFDPARDLLLAWNNLNKFSLIGQPTGIPNVFYPPYWMWLLSIGVFFSKDPRFSAVIVGLIPYFIIFPFVWFRFSKIFGLKSVLIVWILFMLGSGFSYSTQLWNPYPAPLLATITILLLTLFSINRITLKSSLLSLLVGFFAGLTLSFHMSFGIVLCFGIFIFMLWEGLIIKKPLNALFLSLATFLGILIALMPFLLFEARHGFHQIQALVSTFTQYGDVISSDRIKGLSKWQIFLQYIGTFATLLHVNVLIAAILLVSAIAYIANLLKKKTLKVTGIEKKTLMIVGSIMASSMLIYLTAKNPVWNYHFIGIDVLFMILLAFVLSKIPIANRILTVWAIAVAFISVFSAFYPPSKPNTWADKREVVKIITQDSGTTKPVIFVYKDNIYSYEYTYFFRWFTGMDIPYDPSQNPKHPNVMYLIIPKNLDKNIANDFINYRSPNSIYRTIQEWGDSDIVLKRVKRN